ncbi:MAG: hypothetical protein AAF386_02000, partial [Pseudomonadota bacterium]
MHRPLIIIFGVLALALGSFFAFGGFEPAETAGVRPSATNAPRDSVTTAPDATADVAVVADQGTQDVAPTTDDTQLADAEPANTGSMTSDIESETQGADTQTAQDALAQDAPAQDAPTTRTGTAQDVGETVLATNIDADTDAPMQDPVVQDQLAAAATPQPQEPTDTTPDQDVAVADTTTTPDQSPAQSDTTDLIAAAEAALAAAENTATDPITDAGSDPVETAAADVAPVFEQNPIAATTQTPTAPSAIGADADTLNIDLAGSPRDSATLATAPQAPLDVALDTAERPSAAIDTATAAPLPAPAPVIDETEVAQDDGASTTDGTLTADVTIPAAPETPSLAPSDAPSIASLQSPSLGTLTADATAPAVPDTPSLAPSDAPSIASLQSPSLGTLTAPSLGDDIGGLASAPTVEIDTDSSAFGADTTVAAAPSGLTTTPAPTSATTLTASVPTADIDTSIVAATSLSQPTAPALTAPLAPVAFDVAAPSSTPSLAPAPNLGGLASFDPVTVDQAPAIDVAALRTTTPTIADFGDVEIGNTDNDITADALPHASLDTPQEVAIFARPNQGALLLTATALGA